MYKVKFQYILQSPIIVLMYGLKKKRQILESVKIITRSEYNIVILLCCIHVIAVVLFTVYTIQESYIDHVLYCTTLTCFYTCKI